MSQGALIFLLLAILLAFVVWVARAFYVHYKINLYVVQLLLVKRKYHIVLEKYYLVLMAHLTPMIHIVKDFVLLSDQKCPFDF